MIVGDAKVFAIESGVTETYGKSSLLALGFFVIHLKDRVYGVRSPRATMLACSFDAVKRRIARRGTHHIPLMSTVDAATIAEAVLEARYGDLEDTRPIAGLLPRDFEELVRKWDIVWAPDGDQAFDDGGHILQFDEGDQVRIVAFINTDDRNDMQQTLSEVWLSADTFYDILGTWRHQFETDWRTAQF